MFDTPCVSTPRRSVMVSASAASAASADVTPSFSKISVTVRRSADSETCTWSLSGTLKRSRIMRGSPPAGDGSRFRSRGRTRHREPRRLLRLIPPGAALYSPAHRPSRLSPGATREEQTMTSITPTRRDVLKGAAALAAVSAVPHRAHAQGGAMGGRARIDSVLRQATDAREVPGVVAMAATGKGVLYEGAFGVRALDKAPAMTTDSVFRIASMTKAITSVAAMQLVEQGKLTLEDPVPNIDPALGSPKVLQGFDAAGAPQLRPAKRPITLRQLLTHTAGFSYEIWDENTVRYVKATGTPATPTGKLDAIRIPLMFDPGDKWEYGVNIDWVGRLVESISGRTLDVYFKEKIFTPLGMKDSGYVTSDEQRARQAIVHTRQADGTLAPQPLETPFTPEFWSGGGPLYSTGRDYLTFLQALLHGGGHNGARILKPGDRGPDGQEPHRQHPGRHHEDGESGALERR